jgi:hypothetical protein
MTGSKTEKILEAVIGILVWSALFTLVLSVDKIPIIVFIACLIGLSLWGGSFLYRLIETIPIPRHKK